MILSLENVYSSYGERHVLFGISLSVDKEEAVALLGRNGMGKTTMLKTIVGVVPARKGMIKFKGQEIVGKPIHQIIRLGIGYVPAERRIFYQLTVRDNLEVAVRKVTWQQWTVEKVFELFPILEKYANKKGGYLSGGEQQMLAIARTLMGNPELLLLDEPTEGLGPLVVKSVADQMQALKKMGVTVLLAEMNVKFALKVSNRVYIMEKGRICYEGSSEDLDGDIKTKRLYLAV
jgi:branched-chain amino acid transport system ATP-binding protein